MERLQRMRNEHWENDTSKEEMFVIVVDDPIVRASASDPVVCDCWSYVRPHKRMKRENEKLDSPDREEEMVQGMRGVIPGDAQVEKLLSRPQREACATPSNGRELCLKAKREAGSGHCWQEH